MSRMATNEYIGTKRRLYATADREKRIKILDEVCETTGYERKYANRLLTGSRKFRERKGRGKTYGEDVAAVLKKVWLESGCPCLPYFKAESIRWVDEYSTQVAHIEPSIREKILAMSDRTMSRMLSGETRIFLPSRRSPALVLRATPSGTAGLHREGTDNSTTNQRITIAEKRRLSVQYLANQKTPSYLHSVFSI